MLFRSQRADALRRIASLASSAATDNLLQTRDLLINHLEHQLLQLQEVRSALHEAAAETNAWAQETQAAAAPAPAPPLKPAIKPTGQLTLESLFAPLNAVPRNTPEAPEVKVEEVPFVNAEVIFEVEPAGQWEPPASTQQEEAPVAAATAVEIRPAMKVDLTSAPGEIDPALEKATLDELNEALTRAFAQIANRNASN